LHCSERIAGVAERRSERELWNQKYGEDSHASLKPDPFLPSAYDDFIEPLIRKPGSALDVAGGVGRHALWLAEKGWQVTLAEVSEVALAKAEQHAAECGARIRPLTADLSTSGGRRLIGRDRYDLILVFFYLERNLFPALLKALKPAGLLIYKTYTVDQLRFAGGPRHPLHLLKHNELLRAFHELRVLHYRETVRDKGVAEFIGQRGT
jgi:tellurite methyltransferase